MSADYIAAIDQGTTSSRCMIFDRDSQIVAVAQKEHCQHFPKPGWVEHDAAEIWWNVEEVAGGALERAAIDSSRIAAVGITNQRETAVLWDRVTGKPVSPAIVWQDTRTDRIVQGLIEARSRDWYREKTGLIPATYFSGPKLAWVFQNQPELLERARAGELAFGTMDSWLVWNLTGGPDGGRHLTDVTNASRTLLMNLRTLEWDLELLEAQGIPREVLPEIVSSSQVYGTANGVLEGVPVAGALGDQQAALVGQVGFDAGELKSTYGTGAFLLLNTGTEPVVSSHGLLTTLAYRFGEDPARFALEGSIAVSGALVQWFRDQLGMIASSSEIEGLASTVPDNGGAYIVPAFSGLFAPYWESDARGVIAGLTGFVTRAHLARAVLEASVWQTRDLVEAMAAETGTRMAELRVDGGMAANDLFLQLLADGLDVEVIRPVVTETTCLGAAYAAGLAVGFWSGVDELRSQWKRDRSWKSGEDAARRESEYAQWLKAIERSKGWLAGDAG